ncbi:MAG TPA: hypothetical protein VHU18_02230 [Rhizomicrobium sp.]|nr:hypothetical protein [Rhizomicrobium sp.]
MANAVNDTLTKVAAWPTDAIRDERGRICGFIMPRIPSRADAHELYGPKSRAVAFPSADFRFLVHVAANIARAFATIHAAGQVIGDINQGHMLVGGDGKVVLIDTDSFQVTINGQRYTCDVGTPLFTPPELQDHSFRGLVRTQNHDLFGLAVMLFHFLFMGRHPYAGVPLHKGEMPIERAIKERRFAYGANAALMGMARPPHTVPLETFGPSIAQLFEAAFSAQTVMQTDSSGKTAVQSPPRPTALAWLNQIGQLAQSLKQCSASAAHFYPKHLASCPWCQVERGTGVRLFGFKIEATASKAIDVATLWQAIERVPRPPDDPPLPSSLPWQPPPGTNLPDGCTKLYRQVGSVAAASFGVVGCMAFQATPGAMWLAIIAFVAAAVIWPRVPAAKRAAADAKIAAATGNWNRLAEQWDTQASVKGFDATKYNLAKLRAALGDLPNEKARRVAKLREEQREFQRRRYLDRFRIDRADIPGVKSGRAALLASFGIETAYDVAEHRIAAVKGFGPVLTKQLLDWRRAKEATFRYNPNEPIDPGELARVQAEIGSHQEQLVHSLRDGAIQLQRISQEISAARGRLAPVLKVAWDKLQVAEAERKAL